MSAEQEKTSQTASSDHLYLPCLPHVLLHLLEQANDYSSQDWAEQLAVAPELTVQVLLACKSHTKAGEVISSLEQATTTAGAETCRLIIYNAALRHVFGRNSGSILPQLKRHWWQSLLRTHLAYLIAEQLAYPEPEEVRLSGMMIAAEQAAAWLSEEPTRGDKAGEASNTRMPQAHLNQWLLSNLGFSSFVKDALRFHQEPLDRVVESHPLVAIVWLANALAVYLTGDGPPLGDASKILFQQTLDIPRLTETARQQSEDLAKRFGLEPPPPPEPLPGYLTSERRQFRSVTVPSFGQNGESPEDQEVRRRLAREVRDFALIEAAAGSLKNLPPGHARLAGCAAAASMLFDVAPPIFFLPRKDKTLCAYPLPGQPMGLSALAVPIQGGRSACAAAVSTATMTSTSTDEAASVLDHQIAEQLGSKDVLYLPLVYGGSLSGLAALGITRQQVANKQRLLQRYGSICAQMLSEPGKDGHAQQAQEESALRTEIKRVIHEVNNPLSIIKNYLRLLGSRLDSDESSSKGLSIIGEEIERIASTLRSMSATSSVAGAHEQESTDVNEVITDLLGISRDTLFSPARIYVATHLANQLPPLVTHRDRLKQILLNLLKNAAEAMPAGGTLTLTTRDNVNRDGRFYVEITISDTGPGLPTQVLENLFKPVASTKGGGHGGIGLSIIGELAATLNISVTCTSDASGTSFQLLVPRSLPGTG